MAIQRTRKNKENPHYGFLVSWQPSAASVKGDLTGNKKNISYKPNNANKADILAQDEQTKFIKNDIIKSIMRVSFILILELVLYLAWNQFVLRSI